MVLTVSFALSSVIGFLVTVIGENFFHQLDAGVEASGPHDFAVREKHHSSLVPPRPSHPCPTFVTIAKRPSVLGRDGEDEEVIWVKSEPEYFCKGGWTDAWVICPSRQNQSTESLRILPGRAPRHRALAMAALQRSPPGRLAAQRGLPVLYR